MHRRYVSLSILTAGPTIPPMELVLLVTLALESSRTLACLVFLVIPIAMNSMVTSVSSAQRDSSHRMENANQLVPPAKPTTLPTVSAHHAMQDTSLQVFNAFYPELSQQSPTATKLTQQLELVSSVHLDITLMSLDNVFKSIQIAKISM